MSDQSPPPKPKPGSLRDRIAAFENKGSAPAPPPPRPKPGGLSQWKPKPPSPPPVSPDNVQSGDRKPTNNAGMSATDAMESIGRAGSLKERMAALQGKGAFGGPPPPIAPKPNVDKPKWKPPVPASSEVDPDASGRETSSSPPPRAVGSPSPEDQGEANRDSEMIAREADGGDPDPEEEERQRRAVIAARMARLGGARLGMGPPIFAPKPVVRKSEPPPSAPEVQDDDVRGDQPTIVEESNQDSVTSPLHDPPAAVSPASKAVAETEHKDDPESPPPVPVRISASMPVPVGPRRAAPPRKKAPKNAPTTALPEPPVEEAEGVAIHSPPIPNEPPTSADLATHDPSLVIADSQEEIVEMAVAVEAAHHEDPDIKTDAEQHTALPSVHTETFHEQIVEPEAQEEHVEATGSHVKEHAAAETHSVPLEQAQEAIEAEEEEEARHQRVATKLAQMGAFNPLAGPPPVPSRESLNEPVLLASEARLDVEDEVNVDTEEYGKTIPPPPFALPSHDTVHSIKHDAAEPHVKPDPHMVKVGEDGRVPAHRDGEHAVVLHTEEQGDGHELPPAVSSEGLAIHHDLVHVAAVHELVAASTQEAVVFDVPGTIPIGADAQHDQLHGDTDAPLAHSAADELEHDKSNDEAQAEEMPPPRINRPIPPPPVNLRSKPTPPSSPPISPPPRAPVQTLRVDEVECPPSPDIPPRPIPPPGRSGSMTEDVPPRRSMPPPPRRTSVRVTEPVVDAPSSPPPVPTAPRPISRRPETPQIITTLVTQEQEPEAPQEDEQEEVHVAEETASESVTPRPDVPEDDASARRRAIAERMAKLGGIRFGGPPPPMNPLSRPPLPAAPPPTSIPPDDVDEEEKGPREEEEEEEAARKQRIAAKLAGMGGMRLGMLPPGAGLPPPTARRPSARQEESESEDAMPPVPIPAPPQRPPPTRKPPPPVEASENDGMQTEVEESDIEHVRHTDVPAVLSDDDSTTSRSARSPEALPTPPPRMTSRSPPPGRPPIPMIPLLGRRASGTASVSSSRQASLDEPSAARHQSEYVLVDADGPDDPSTSPPPRRRGGPMRTIPALPPVPPPSAIDPPEALSLSGSTVWELPTIPQGPEFSEELASSWSEDSTAVAGARSSSKSVRAGVVRQGSTASVSVSGSGSGTGSDRRSVDQPQQQQPAPPTPDALMALSHTTGTRVVQTANALFEKSKRALVGDGSHVGFVRAVLAQVPGAAYPAEGAHDAGDWWGHVVYAQTGSAVQRRVSDISPGDVIAFWDAKLKGHKGLHTYTQTAGAGEAPLVGIVSGFDAKKSKVRVWQANQHVGQQTVETASYRLEDLKSGQVKVYRVLEA